MIKENNQTIEGEGLRIRPVEAGDLDFLRELRNKPESRIWFFTQDLITAESQARWFEKYLQDPNDYFFVAEAAELGRVGSVAIDYNDRENRVGTVLRTLVDPALRGQGIALRAMRLLCAFGFDCLNLSALVLEIVEGNAAAARVYERCGFVLDKTAKGGTFRTMDGTTQRKIPYRLTREGWLSNRGTARFISS